MKVLAKSILQEQEEVNEKNKVEGGFLYLVTTPIGNLADLSERAIKVLREVDFVAAEDTRNTMKLMHHIGAKKPMVSYFEHNKRQRGEEITARILRGESCALVTDAGTPAISDPGEDLVRLCVSLDIPVTAVPGACAAIDALALSALSTGRFAFEGFLSTAKGERRARLQEIKNEMRTLIFYEAPHKLTQTLNDLYETFGERRLTLCRELTKKNEEIIYTTIQGAIALYKEKSPRGEYVLVLEGGFEAADGKPTAETDNETEGLLLLSPLDHVAHYEQEGMSRMDAIKKAAKDRAMTKSAFYRLLCDEKE